MQLMKATGALRRWFSGLPLFWQISLPNGIVLIVATTVLALSPASVPSRITTAQALELLVALALLVAINVVLIRRTVEPLRRMTEVMARIDPLVPGQRAPTGGGSAEATRLAGVFNAMLDRLEAERRESGARMLSAQERERVRLARELHDEIGQSITGLMLEIDRVARGAPSEIETELREIQEGARGLAAEVREIVRRLRPEMLDDLGLRSAIVALSEQFSDQAGIKVERRIDRELPPLSEDAELVLYRVAQESLTNVARHSGAGRVELDLGASADGVELSVADDGVGPEHVEPRSGIQGMRERALLVGAQLAIDRGPAGGMRVRLQLPAEELG